MRRLSLWRYLRGRLTVEIVFGAVAALAIPLAGATLTSVSKNPSPKLGHYSLPLSFEENRGQADSSIAFLGRGAGFSAAFRKNEADFRFAQRTASSSGALQRLASNHPEPVSAESLRMRLVGANPSSRIEGAEPLSGTANYFIGNNPANWRTNIPTFARIRYARVYPGIDLEYYGSQQRLEFDFKLASGADPAAIRFRLDDARKLSLDLQGDLIAMTDGGPIIFHAPEIYQPDGKGNKLPIAGSFRISTGHTVSFTLGKYDRARPLVIDPILNYSTLLAPGSTNYPIALAVDGSGDVYVTGSASFGFPISAGAFQANPPSEVQGSYPYVAKLNSTGTALLYSTYITGTSGGDWSSSIAVDANGNAYIAGTTSSTDFPVTPGAFQATDPTKSYPYGTEIGSGFVTKLNSTGTGLIYSTYLGGSQLAVIQGLAVDGSGSAYVTGNTGDLDFPTTAGAYQTTAPLTTLQGQSGFVTKLNPAGSALVYSTYLSGGNGDWPAAIALDTTGEAYVTGWTSSQFFPITPNAIQKSLTSTSGGFVTKLKSDGSGLVYSTFLGDILSGIAADGNGNAYVAGEGGELGFPITPGAIDQPNGSFIVSKLNSSGTALVYSALFGGSNAIDSYLNALALDSQGNVIVGGCTISTDYPVTPGALETQNLALLYDGQLGGFLTKIDPAGANILYSTYFGGTGNQEFLTNGDCPGRIAVDGVGNVYVAGGAGSPDFPTTPGVVIPSATWGGGFIAEFNASEMTSLPLTSINVTSSAPSVEFGQPVTFTAKVQPTSGQTPTGILGFSFYGRQAADGVDGNGEGFGPWTWASLDSSGTATYVLDTSTLTLDQLQFNVQYLGDANNAPSRTSGSDTLTLIPTTTTLTSSQNPVLYGTPVTFTATVLDNTGKPAKGVILFAIGNIEPIQPAALDANGQASWTTDPQIPPPAGNDTVLAEFDPIVGYAASSTTISQTFTPLGTTPTPALNPPSGTYNSGQSIAFDDANSAAEIYYTTDGSTPVVGSSNTIGSNLRIQLSSSETIKAIAVATGYAPSAMTSATYAIVLPPPNFSLGGNAISVWQGETSNNTSAVVVTPTNGFVGTVTLNAAITSSPSGAVDPPTLSFGTTNPVTITSANVGRAILTISTTAPSPGSSAQARPSELRWLARGGTALAFCLIFGVSTKRKKWRSVLGLAGLCVVLLCGVQACGGIGGGGQRNPGTTPGSYTVTVTGTSGTLQQTTIITVIVDYAS